MNIVATAVYIRKWRFLAYAISTNVFLHVLYLP